MLVAVTCAKAGGALWLLLAWIVWAVVCLLKLLTNYHCIRNQRLWTVRHVLFWSQPTACQRHRHRRCIQINIIHIERHKRLWRPVTRRRPEPITT